MSRENNSLMSSPGTKTYLIVRHAQSANNALPEYQRICDPDLTPIGTLQAQRLASYLKDYPIDRIYCSGFLRSIETAAAISTAKHLPAYVHGQLHEVKGCYSGHIETELRSEPGMGRSEILRRYSHWEIDPLISDLGWNHSRLVETEEQADQRAYTVAQWLIKDANNSQSTTPNFTILVIHADFKVKLLQILYALNANRRNDRRRSWIEESPKNTSITTVKFASDRAIDIADYNCVAHLPIELVT